MTTDSLPTWFLDVDGVVNIFPKGTPPKNVQRGEASPFSPTPYAGEVMFPITWRTDIIERMVSMHEEKIVELRWLTTWGYGANYGLQDLIGLPRLEVVADPEHEPFRTMGWHTWWKAEAVRRYRAEHGLKKFVWTDDDLAAQQKSVADIIAWDDVDMMLVSPEEHRGITHEHLDEIEKFLRA